MRSVVEPVLGAVAACCACVALAACGGAGPGGAGDAESVPSYLTATRDRDDDQDRNTDDARTLDFGQAANAADRRASTALVKHYFATAVLGDGAAGCALLTPYVVETLPEDSSQAIEATTASRSCAAVLSEIFRQHHRELVEKQAVMRVDAVRVQGERGLVILDFPSLPEVRLMVEHRVGGGWRLMQELDSLVE